MANPADDALKALLEAYVASADLTKQDLLSPRSVAKKRIYDRLLERCCPIEINDINRRAKAMQNNILDMKKLLGI